MKHNIEEKVRSGILDVKQITDTNRYLRQNYKLTLHQGKRKKKRKKKHDNSYKKTDI